MRDLPQKRKELDDSKVGEEKVPLLCKLNSCCSPNSICSTGDERNPTRMDHWMKFISDRHGIGLVGGGARISSTQR